MYRRMLEASGRVGSGEEAVAAGVGAAMGDGDDLVAGLRRPTVATGAAWSARLRRSGQVTVCFLGEGETDVGAVHEAFALAVAWQLPVVFVGAAGGRRDAGSLEPAVVDASDPDAVRAVTSAAIGRARQGEGPSLVVPRLHGGRGNDPIAHYRACLEEAGADPAGLRRIEDEVTSAVEAKGGAGWQR